MGLPQITGDLTARVVHGATSNYWRPHSTRISWATPNYWGDLTAPVVHGATPNYWDLTAPVVHGHQITGDLTTPVIHVATSNSAPVVYWVTLNYRGPDITRNPWAYNVLI